ncbi:MAG TPA: four helix bundle protein [Gemmatimonadaceae bacterium]|nr:four helix bundle protein [Gemmatimonadaceae bacterium]
MRTLEELGALGKVQAYVIARRLRSGTWEDSTLLLHDPRLVKVAGQLVEAVGSIPTAISEGYARRSRADRIRFYEYALGSANESCDWYESAEPILDPGVVKARLADLLSICRLLLTMIANERAAKAAGNPIPSAADNRPRNKRATRHIT